MGCKPSGSEGCRTYAKGTTQTRLENIAKEGAQVDIQEMNYDDCVRLAAKEADETPRGVIVQDYRMGRL